MLRGFYVSQAEPSHTGQKHLRSVVWLFFPQLGPSFFFSSTKIPVFFMDVCTRWVIGIKTSTMVDLTAAATRVGDEREEKVSIYREVVPGRSYPHQRRKLSQKVFSPLGLLSGPRNKARQGPEDASLWNSYMGPLNITAKPAALSCRSITLSYVEISTKKGQMKNVTVFFMWLINMNLGPSPGPGDPILGVGVPKYSKSFESPIEAFAFFQLTFFVPEVFQK